MKPRTFAPAPALAIAFVLAGASAALAGSCEETFARLLMEGNGDTPVEINVTQEIKGGPTTVNIFRQAEPGHWMTEMVDPPDQAWVLTHGNVMYTSNDKGASWSKVRDVDSALNRAQNRKTQEENAATVRDAVCGSEMLDGVVHDTVEATFDNVQGFKTENRYTYWVNASTGWISRAVYRTKGSGFESVTTQVIAPASDLNLPTP